VGEPIIINSEKPRGLDCSLGLRTTARVQINSAAKGFAHKLNDGVRRVPFVALVVTAIEPVIVFLDETSALLCGLGQFNRDFVLVWNRRLSSLPVVVQIINGFAEGLAPALGNLSAGVCLG